MNVISNINSSALLAAIIFILFYGSMLLFSKLLQKIEIIKNSTTVDNGRYGALDGLRGVLAYGVMVHHSITAYNYFETGIWQWSENPTLNNLGQSTVAIFFMITGFLFTEKIASGTTNWRALYISRAARLIPLHSIVIIVLFLIIILLTNFKLKVTPISLTKELLQWLTFVIFGRPDINGFDKSWIIIAGVNWSLKYEWGFYIIGLPILNLLFKFLSRNKVLFGLLLLIAIYSIVATVKGDETGPALYLIHFVCGIASALIFKSSRGRKFISSTPFKIIAVASLSFMMIFPNSGTAPVLLASILFFLAIVGGYSFFGALRSPAAVWLGDISYGIYLIHGMLLWITFHTNKSIQTTTDLNSSAFILLLLGLGTAVMLIATASYLYLEKPMISYGKSLSQKFIINRP